MTKRILVYGDSNVWGQKSGGGRYESRQQWTNILQQHLGDDYEIIQSGVYARIAGDYDTQDAFRNGKTSYEVAYVMAFPVQYVIVALGSNDLKEKYHRSAQDIYADLMWYGEATREYQVHDRNKFSRDSDTKVLFLAPPNFVVHANGHGLSESTRQELNQLLVASEYPVVVIDDLKLGDDGAHFTAEDHETVAQRVYEKLKEIET